VTGDLGPDPSGCADRAAADRAAFRAFVREHHPDRGGDPAVFVAGLARLRSAQAGPGPAADRGPAADPRWDAPIVFAPPLPAPLRVAVALIRTARWHRRRRVR
jgi:hypothetical protein